MKALPDACNQILTLSQGFQENLERDAGRGAVPSQAAGP